MDSLEEFKSIQRLAYEGAVATRKKLEVGMTEKEACRLLEEFFRERKIDLFFHRPFAWFGDRTSFTNFKRPALPNRGQPIPHLGKEFMPSDRKLETGMAVILDVAPSVKGLAVDIGYSFSFGENEKVTKARKDLLEIRKIILSLATERKSIKEIYRIVERKLTELGYSNRHDLYPLGVLGHRIGKLPLLKFPRINVMGFHPQAFFYLMKEKALGPAFVTEDDERPLTPGLWAFEPHIGGDGFGVKFEEILVVTENEVYWLDENLPHVEELN